MYQDVQAGDKEVRDANIDTPNAVCNICLAEQLDF